MTTAGSRWGVVMSRNSGFSEQVFVVIGVIFFFPGVQISCNLSDGISIFFLACEKGYKTL